MLQYLSPTTYTVVMRQTILTGSRVSDGKECKEYDDNDQSAVDPILESESSLSLPFMHIILRLLRLRLQGPSGFNQCRRYGKLGALPLRAFHTPLAHDHHRHRPRPRNRKRCLAFSDRMRFSVPLSFLNVNLGLPLSTRYVGSGQRRNRSWAVG